MCELSVYNKSEKVNTRGSSEHHDTRRVNGVGKLELPLKLLIVEVSTGPVDPGACFLMAPAAAAAAAGCGRLLCMLTCFACWACM